MAQSMQLRAFMARTASGWGILMLCLLASGLFACDFTSVQPITLSVSGTHNAAPGFAQVYALTSPDGQIVAVSNQPNFPPMPYGQYQAHAINYEIANPPATLPTVGTPLANITGGCTDIFTRPGFLTVCETSILQACENSGQMIRIVVSPDHNQQPTYHEIVVIVDAFTGNIVAFQPVNSAGMALFTTTTGTGQLQAGSYLAYALNYADPHTPASLGITLGLPWTGNFGLACAQASPPAGILIDPPGACVGGTSNLTACENSGDVIVVHAAGYQNAPGFVQAVVIIDRNTGQVVATALSDAAGFAVFSTLSGTGDLQAGTYWAYAINIQSPDNLSTLGLTPGNFWPGSWGAACADTSLRVPVTVTTPGACTFPLPFHQITLTAKSMDGGNQLNWANQGQANAPLQVIERLTPPSTVTTLHTFQPNPQANTFFDSSPLPNVNTYRIRCQHADGQIHYSNTVGLATSMEPQFNLFPNPSQGGTCAFQWSGLTDGGLRIGIYDLLGRNILQNHLHDLAPSGQQTFNFPTPLAPGSYWVQFTLANGHSQALRLIIVQ